MKLAWICYEEFGDDRPRIVFEEPPSWKYWKVVPIVYAEIVT